MKEINGITIKNLNILYQRKGYLLYYEGPILSLYEGDDQRLYLIKWVDSNDGCNRWLAIPVINQQLLDFLTKKISLKQLILNVKPDLVFFLDLDNDLKINRLEAQLVNKIHQEYLPPKDAYYHEEHYHPYTQKLLKEIIAQNKGAQSYEVEESTLDAVSEPTPTATYKSSKEGIN
ncbi:MAG: DUF6575 domain-containing protein [Bacteroidota bacterium]